MPCSALFTTASLIWPHGACPDQGLRLDGKADAPYEEIARAIDRVPGVVAHGLVVRSGVVAVVATAAGPSIMMQVRPWKEAAADLVYLGSDMAAGLWVWSLTCVPFICSGRRWKQPPTETCSGNHCRAWNGFSGWLWVVLL